MTANEPQKKSRLSSLFGGKKTKDKDQSSSAPGAPDAPGAPSAPSAPGAPGALSVPNASSAPGAPNGMNHDVHPSTSTAATSGLPESNGADSAYASSAHPSSKRGSISGGSPDIVPVQNNGNIDGVGPERNLAYNTSTGQVVDDDTGQVVVTTTTTTTTTMSTRGGKKETKVDVHTQKDGQPAIAEAPGDMPSASATTTEQSPVQPPRPSPNSMDHSPVGAPPPQQNNGPPSSYAPPRADPDTFPIPARNPMREREHMEPVSPLRPNFSYPSRTDLREEPMPQQVPKPQGTFANLRAAAEGLHGVGETVRGTLNNEVDTRFPRSNSKKAAAANAKNQSVLDRGNSEMARMNMRRSQDRRSQDFRRSSEMPPEPQMQSPGYNEPMPQQLMPGPPRQQQHPQQYQQPPPQQQQLTPPLPQSEPNNSSAGALSGSYGGSSTEMSQVPPSFSPESSAPDKKQGGLRKLMKRRPVPST